MDQKQKKDHAYRAIHRLLFRRLVLAAFLISALFSVLLILKERGRLGEVALERARITTAVYSNLTVGTLLDRPEGPEWDKMRQEMEKYLSQSGRLGKGHFVFVQVLDRAGQPKASVARNDYPLAGPVRQFVESSPLRSLPEQGGSFVESTRIEGTPHIQVALPLTNSAGEIAAHLRGVFAVSADAIEEIEAQLLRTIGFVIGLVFLTTVLLYPTILRLMRQVTRLSRDLLDANVTTIRLLGSAIAKRDSDTDIHNYRVTIYSVRIAEAFGLTGPAIRALIKGAFLHDVGKIGISDNILLKPGRLTEEEFAEMKKHVQYGIDIISSSAWLADAADVVGNHHEKYDGSGYDARLQGEQIPQAARIFALADVFDALTSKRPYKEPLSFEEAMSVMEAGRERHFDPQLLDLFKGIARPLYEEFGNRDDDHPRHVLTQIGRRYFREDFNALLENSH